MSLLPQIVYEVPEETARIARAAFPKSNPYLRLADTLGVIYQDGDFAHLFPFTGQPAHSKPKLALSPFELADDCHRKRGMPTSTRAKTGLRRTRRREN